MRWRSCIRAASAAAPGAFGELMRVLVVGAHGVGDLGVAHLHDAVGALQDDAERLGVGAAHGHAVGHGVGAVGRHDLAGGKRQRIGRRLGRHHAHHLGRGAERIAHGDHAADARAQADRHIDRVERRRAAEQLQRIGRHAAHQVAVERWDHREPAFARQPHSDIARGIEIVAGLDQLRPEGAHGGVLFHRIALRHDDGGGNARLGGAEGDALAVIASGGADHAFESGCVCFSRSM